MPDSDRPGEATNGLMTAREAAQALRIDVRTLRRWSMRGRGPVRVVLGPRSTRYRRADVQAYIDRNREEPGL